MIRLAVALAVLGFSGSALAQTKSCDDLKGEIETKLKAKGIEKYTLEIVAKDADAKDAKAIGSCEGGTKKILYKRA